MLRIGDAGNRLPRKVGTYKLNTAYNMPETFTFINTAARTSNLILPVTITACHHHSLSPPQPVTITVCHHDSLSPPQPVTITACHHHSLSPSQPVTITASHHHSLSPSQPVTITASRAEHMKSRAVRQAVS